jgi:hypothetical protein
MQLVCKRYYDVKVWTHPVLLLLVSLLQYELLDLLNCLIAPLFFANALSMFSASMLNSIYCAVLLIKGYQMGLLLLPRARQQQAHKRTR